MTISNVGIWHEHRAPVPCRFGRCDAESFQTERGGAVSYTIRTEGLVKRYGKVVALDGLDLEVPKGTVLGLLGPNGAGKTTAVRILTTLLDPDGGSVEVAGLDVCAEPVKVRKRIGLSGQTAAVDEHLTGYENLDMVGRLYHLGRRLPRNVGASSSSDSIWSRLAIARRRPTPEACGVDSTWRQRSWRSPRSSFSTSPRPVWTPAVGSTCGKRSRSSCGEGRRCC
jgi:hypothetical protein